MQRLRMWIIRRYTILGSAHICDTADVTFIANKYGINACLSIDNIKLYFMAMSDCIQWWDRASICSLDNKTYCFTVTSQVTSLRLSVTVGNYAQTSAVVWFTISVARRRRLQRPLLSYMLFTLTYNTGLTYHEYYDSEARDDPRQSCSLREVWLLNAGDGILFIDCTLGSILRPWSLLY